MHYERIPDTLPILSGEGLTLRELTEADLPAWFGRRTDTEAAALAGNSIATNTRIVSCPTLGIIANKVYSSCKKDLV